MKKRFIFLSLFSMMLIGLFSSKQTVLAEDKTYQIGTDVTFAPFEFQNTDNIPITNTSELILIY